MLVAILGPSGVGKSSIIRELQSSRDISYLRSYTTRPPRGDSFDDRVSVSVESYEEMLALKLIAIDTEIHGKRYGVLKADLLAASEGPSLTVVDWSIYDVHVLAQYMGKWLPCIYLFPEVPENVGTRLRARDGGQLGPERLASAEAEVRDFFNGTLDQRRLAATIAIRHNDFNHGYRQVVVALERLSRSTHSS